MNKALSRLGYGTVLDEPPPPHVSNPYRDVLMSERQGPAYYRSEKWQQKRAAALQAADHCCEVCNSPHELQVHHRTYERLCKELPGDLTVLCRTCHCIFHVGGRVLGLYVEEEGVVL
jgi:hypothetical protein